MTAKRHIHGQLRTCLKCGHTECPGCKGVGDKDFGWCDILRIEGDDVILCCDGECTYKTSDVIEQ